MPVPLHKYLDGHVVQIIDRMVKDTFRNNKRSGATSASIKLTLGTTGLEVPPVVTIFCHEPDPLSEAIDYIAWREAVFGRQVYDLMRFLDEREQVVSSISLEVTMTGSDTTTSHHMNLIEHATT